MSDENNLSPELTWANQQSGAGTRWRIHKSMLIGRERADIEVPVGAVSRQHARVYNRMGVCAIEDLGSRNGTSVNGTLLTSGDQHPLRDGDVLLLAGMVELTFKDPMATPIAPRIGKLRGLWIDQDSGDVWIDSQLVVPALSGKQYALLKLIYLADGKVVTRDEIIASVWSYASPDGISNDAVDSLVKRLRKRLAEYTSHPMIELVRDKGIRLVEA